jgi:DNA-binding transcriptional LysR family regulator
MDRIIAAQVFLTIAEKGSLTATSDKLRMSRAMVTRYLAEMESWVGARLINRTTRKLILTGAGEEAITRCRQLLELNEQMGHIADTNADEPRGELRIASSPSLAQAGLARAVTHFLLKYPRISVDLQISNHAVNLADERIDLAIRITNELDPNLIARPLGQCVSTLCASPAYLLKRGTPRHPQDLQMHNCLTFSYFGKSVWELHRNSEQIAVSVSGNLSSNESVVLLAACIEGAGISMQPQFCVEALVANGSLVTVLPQVRPRDMGIYAIFPSRQHMPARLRVLLDFLVEWYGRGLEQNNSMTLPV